MPCIIQQECSKGKYIYMAYIKRLKKNPAKTCLHSLMYLFHIKHILLSLHTMKDYL